MNHSAQFYTWKERKEYSADDETGQGAVDYETTSAPATSRPPTNAFLDGNSYHARTAVGSPA